MADLSFEDYEQLVFQLRRSLTHEINRDLANFPPNFRHVINVWVHLNLPIRPDWPVRHGADHRPYVDIDANILDILTWVLDYPQNFQQNFAALLRYLNFTWDPHTQIPLVDVQTFLADHPPPPPLQVDPEFNPELPLMPHEIGFDDVVEIIDLDHPILPEIPAHILDELVPIVPVVQPPVVPSDLPWNILFLLFEEAIHHNNFDILLDLLRDLPIDDRRTRFILQFLIHIGYIHPPADAPLHQVLNFLRAHPGRDINHNDSAFQPWLRIPRYAPEPVPVQEIFPMEAHQAPMPALQPAPWMPLRIQQLLTDGYRPWCSRNNAKNRRFPPTTHISEIQKLLDLGVITPHHGRTNFMSPAFFIPKANSTELRFIVNFKHMTPLLPKPKFSLPMFWPKLFRRFEQCTHAISIDLTKAFYQIKLHPSAQAMTCHKFTASSPVYKMTRLPMGLRQSPALLQSVASAIQTRLRSLHPSLFIYTYLDDWFFAGSPTQLRAVVQTLHQLTSEISLQINWKKSHITPSTSITYLGVLIDLTERTFQLTPAYAQRAYTAFRGLQHAEALPERVRLEYTGVLSYMCMVLALPYALAYHPTLPESHAIWQILVRNRFKAAFRDHGDVYQLNRPTIFTDATTTRVAALLPDHVIAADIPELPIFLAEAIALLMAIRLAPPRARFKTDNQALFHILTSRRVPTHHLTYHIQCHIWYHRHQVTWVSTHLNPADLPSRSQIA